MYILTVNTRKTTRSLSIFPHEKTSIQLLIFLRVFCSFPEEVNADNAVLIPRKNFTSPGYPNTEKACFGWIVRVFHNIPRDLRWRTDTVANALQWMQAFRRYIFIANWVKYSQIYGKRKVLVRIPCHRPISPDWLYPSTEESKALIEFRAAGQVWRTVFVMLCKR